MSDLKTALMDIQGVGTKTAESIIEVLQEQDSNLDNPILQKAIIKAQENEDREAAIYLRRYARDNK